MPTYDYKCDACGHNWELYQSMNDSPRKKCPKCKKYKRNDFSDLVLELFLKVPVFTKQTTKQRAEKKKKRTQVLENHLILQNLQKIKVQTTKKTPLQKQKVVKKSICFR